MSCFSNFRPAVEGKRRTFNYCTFQSLVEDSMPSLQSSDQRNFGNTVVIESIPPLIVLLLKCPMKGQTGCLSRISSCFQELPLPAPLCYLDPCKDRLPPAFSWLEHTLVLVCGFAESELALSNGYLESMRKKFRSLKTKFVRRLGCPSSAQDSPACLQNAHSPF